MTRPIIPWLLLGALAALWTASSVADDTESAGIAVVRLQLADEAAAHAREESTRNATLAAAYSADSTRWEAERAEARAAREAADVRARQSTLRAAAVATELVARLDSTEAAMFTEYRAERDSIDVATDAVVEALTVQLATVTADRDALLSVVTGLRSEITARTAEASQLRAAIDALQDRIRGLERQGNIVKTVGALAVGFIVLDKMAS